MYVADIYTVNALDIIIYQAEGSIGDIWEKKKDFDKWHSIHEIQILNDLILISELIMNKKICLCL